MYKKFYTSFVGEKKNTLKTKIQVYFYFNAEQIVIFGY